MLARGIECQCHHISTEILVICARLDRNSHTTHILFLFCCICIVICICVCCLLFVFVFVFVWQVTILGPSKYSLLTEWVKLLYDLNFQYCNIPRMHLPAKSNIWIHKKLWTTSKDKQGCNMWQLQNISWMKRKFKTQKFNLYYITSYLFFNVLFVWNHFEVKRAKMGYCNFSYLH